MVDAHKFPENWGATTSEQALSFPCDRFLRPRDAVYFRAVTVRAPASVMFRWLCQLRVAPYSYDWIDNGGRKSPRKLIPGLELLQVGQRMCSIFRLADFEQDRHITLRLHEARAQKQLGEVVMTYLVLPRDDENCRLIAKLICRYPRGFRGNLRRECIAWGDLIMMRKQLLTFQYLAEKQYRSVKVHA